MRVELIRADDPAWDARLQAVHRDVFHSAGYHRYAEVSGEGAAFMAVVTDGDRGIAWPYLLRPVGAVRGLAGSDATDVTSVYGYPGPLAWGCSAGDPFVAAAWSSVHDAWLSQGAVAAFTRFHPLLGNAGLLASVPDAGRGVVPGGQTVSIDCTIDDAEARARYRKDLRQHIDRSRRAGLETEHDEDWTELDTFVRLYHATMRRNGAGAYYFFDRAAIERLRRNVEGHVHLLVTRLGERVAVAGVFTEFDGIVQAYLEGSDDDLLSLSPAKVQTDDARRWARQRGDRVLHLGGGRGGREDSLFWAKSRFSQRRHAFHVGRWVLDRVRYDALTAAHAEATGGSAPTDHFPAYRAPVAHPGAIGLR